MDRRRHRLVLGVLAVVIVATSSRAAVAQTSPPTSGSTAAPTTAAPATASTTAAAPTTATTIRTATTTAVAATGAAVSASTRRATATTARRATTTVRRATTAKTATTAAPTTAAPTTAATTVAASTIPPTTIALVTTPSVTSARVNDRSSTRTVNGVIVGLLVLAGLVALLTIWFYRRTAPLPVALEPLELMSRRSWRKRPAAERDAQLAALRHALGDVPPERLVNAPPVVAERPIWRPTGPIDDSVADALVSLVPPPVAPNGNADPPGERDDPSATELGVTDPATPEAAPEPVRTDTLDPHG